MFYSDGDTLTYSRSPASAAQTKPLLRPELIKTKQQLRLKLRPHHRPPVLGRSTSAVISGKMSAKQSCIFCGNIPRRIRAGSSICSPAPVRTSALTFSCQRCPCSSSSSWPAVNAHPDLRRVVVVKPESCTVLHSHPSVNRCSHLKTADFFFFKSDSNCQTRTWELHTRGVRLIIVGESATQTWTRLVKQWNLDQM